jgi:GT2 family glycosyltransferase
MSVSIITACRNRVKPLSISIASWIQFDEVDEIIITDWNSDEPIDHLTRLSKKIKVIRVNNEPYFNQPQPLNLAASLVKTECLLKLDNDHLLNPYFNFFDTYKISDDSFVSGCNGGQRGMDAYFLYPLWGLLYVNSEVFRKVGGYNENMGKYYAVEDDELSVRLIAYGLKPSSIDVQKFTALHIAHTDKDRVKNFESFESINNIVSQTKKDLNTDQLYNYMAQLCRSKNHSEHPTISKVMSVEDDADIEKYWNFTWGEFKNLDMDWYSEPIYKWEVTQLTDQTYEAVKI